MSFTDDLLLSKKQEKPAKKPAENFTEELLASPAPAEITQPQPVIASGQSGFPAPSQEGITKEFITDPQQVEAGKFMSFAKGVNETFQGFHQLLTRAGEQLGLMDKGSLEEFNKMTKQDRKAFNESFRKEFGDEAAFTIAEVLGRLAPALAVPAGAGLPGAVGTGALFGAAEFTEDNFGQNVAIGAATGALGPIINAVPAFRKFLRNQIGVSKKGRQIIKAIDDFPDKADDEIAKLIGADKALIKQARFAKEGLDLINDTGVDLKLSQITGDVRQEWLERVARDSEIGERLGREIETKQIVQSYKLWKRTAAKLFPKSKILRRAADPNSVRFGEQVNKAFHSILGDVKKGTGLLGKRAVTAKKDFAIIDKVTGNKPIIELNNFRNTITDLIAENSGRAAGSQQLRLAKELTGLLERFDEIPLATGKEMQLLLHNYGRAAKGKTQIFKSLQESFDKRPYRMLYGAIAKDLDDAAEGGTEIAQLLANARNNYAMNTALIDEISESSIGALFGATKKPTIDAIEDSFFRMKPAAIKETMQVLAKADPTLQRQLQRFWLERWMLGATKTASKDVFPFVAGKMAELRTDPAFKAVFNDAESQKLVKKGIDVARRIVMNNQRTGGKTVSRLKEFAGVLASRDPTFVARLGSEIFTPKLISKALLDPEGIKALDALTKPYNQNMAAAILTTLNNIAREDDDNVEPVQ